MKKLESLLKKRYSTPGRRWAKVEGKWYCFDKKKQPVPKE